MSDEEVKVVQAKDATVQFGKGPVYRQGNRVSFKAAASCAIAGLAALIPVFLISAPEKPEVDSKERVKAPENSDLDANGQNISLGTYSAADEREKKDGQNSRRRSPTVPLRGLEAVERPRASKVPPGSMVKAVLVSGASNGPIRAELWEALKVSGETLLPERAVLLGTGQSTENRLYIRFTQVIFKNGQAETIDAAAIDGGDRIAGIRGSKIGRYATKLGAAVGLNFVSGLAEGLQEKEAIGQQVVSRANAKNALLNGASRASLDLANETMSELKSQTPVIEVEAGKEIFVLFGATN